MIVIETKQQSREVLREKYPNGIIADVTESAHGALVRLCPSYPHGGIPIPNSGWKTASSVEDIWQGLKVYNDEGVTPSLLTEEATDDYNRCKQVHNKLIGYRYGVNGLQTISLADARRRIFIPTYRWVLDYKVQDIIERLRKASESKTIVLLDDSTNSDIYNYDTPLSHAYLVKAYVEGLPPYEDVYETIVIHHFYPGRRVISWTTEEKRVKTIKPYIMPQQLELPLDIKYI